MKQTDNDCLFRSPPFFLFLPALAQGVVGVDAASHKHPAGSRPRYADADTSFDGPPGGSVKDLDKNIVVAIEELVLSPAAGGKTPQICCPGGKADCFLMLLYVLSDYFVLSLGVQLRSHPNTWREGSLFTMNSPPTPLAPRTS